MQFHSAEELISFLVSRRPGPGPGTGTGTGPLESPAGQPVGRSRLGWPGQPRPPAFRLSATEATIARLVADGRANKQIAAELAVSLKTVEYHLSNMYRRLGITSRVKLAQLAYLAA